MFASVAGRRLEMFLRMLYLRAVCSRTVRFVSLGPLCFNLIVSKCCCSFVHVCVCQRECIVISATNGAIVFDTGFVDAVFDTGFDDACWFRVLK